MTEKGKELEYLDKNELIYTLMIRQPRFVNDEVFNRAMKIVKRKKAHKLLDKVKFESIKDSLSVQMLHIGPYDDEPITFKIMQKFCDENNLRLRTKVHREIYLSDFRKTNPEKLKTVLRYKVERI